MTPKKKDFFSRRGVSHRPPPPYVHHSSAGEELEYMHCEMKRGRSKFGQPVLFLALKVYLTKGKATVMQEINHCRKKTYAKKI